MHDDRELLCRFAREGAQDAFAQLVQRHIDFVYQTARREVGGDAHHASDVTQAVFLQLARKASALVDHCVLKGWLFATARYVAANLNRAERRRQRREQEAMQRAENRPVPTSDWAATRPLINDALAGLSAHDREAVILRYFEGRDYVEIGARLSLSADAARLRVSRALEKMRVELSRAGVSSGAMALAGTLTAQAASAAPAGLAAAVTSVALAGAGNASGISALLVLMNTTKVQAALFAAVAVAGSLGLFIQQRSQAALRDEINTLRQSSLQLARLESENKRLNTAAENDTAPATDELGKLRARAEALQKRRAELSTVSLPLGVVPAAAWQNRGAATAGDALETLFWAKENADTKTLATLINIDDIHSRQRRDLEESFAAISDHARAELGVSSLTEFVALAWALSAQTSFVGAQMLQARRMGPDDVELRVKLHGVDASGRSDWEMPFRRTSAGWQWRMEPPDFEWAKRGWGQLMRSVPAARNP